MLKSLETWLFKDPESALSLIRRLASDNLRRYLPRYGVAFFFMALVAGSTAASAWIMKDVINEVFINRDAGMVYVIAGAVMVIFSIKGAATYGQNVVMSRIGNSIVANAQRRLYDNIIRQDMSFFDATALGEISTRLSHNTSAARAVLDTVVTSIGRDVLTLFGLVIVMVAQDPVMSLIALVIMPPAVIAVSLLVRRVRKVAKSQFVSLTRIVSIVQETAIGVKVVKSFGVEPRLRKQMARAVGDVERQANKIAALTARTSPLMETLGGFAIAIIILYGGYSVIELGRDPGAFFAFITALLLAYDPAKRLARLQVNLSNNLVGVKLMFELLDRPILLADKPDAKPLEVKRGDIVFDEVSFSYGEAPAVNGLNFHAHPGQVTALVGLSGAGKSTVFSLLERFYENDSGSIKIDGHDIRSVTLESLRHQIALVSQDTFLFDMSVKDNILIGRPGASDEDIIKAAQAANADEFIQKLENGYDNLVGEGGGRLSGGQRQRIAIARAMLRNAPILLLDEATSALDAESENKIQVALKRLMVGRTTLVIAHRLATVRDADKILVMDQGRVVETGSHSTLIEQNGIYKRLCDLQFRDESASQTA